MAENQLEHPLFPPKDDDDEAPMVESIHITRHNPITSRNEYIPKRFDRADLTDLSQIAEWYGGGNYELIAKHGNRISARRSYSIAGPSRPLVEVPAEAPPRGASTPQAPAPAPATSGPPSWMLALLPVVVPVIGEYLRTSAAERTAQSQRADTLMLSMLQQGQQNSQALVQAMASLGSQQSKGGSREDFMAGIEFAENMLTAKLEEAGKSGDGGDDVSKVLENVATIFQGMKALGPAANAAGAVASAAAAATG